MGFDDCQVAPAFSDYWNWKLETKGASVPANGQYLTDYLTDQAIQFIERSNSGPFYLHLAYTAPHYPLQSTKEDADFFRAQNKFDEGVIQTYGMIRRMDQGIGRLMECLQRNGLEENTIVVFTSDNGPFLGEWEGMNQNRFNGFLNGGKGLVLDGGIRVPAIIHWPSGMPADGSVRSGLAHFTDWVPTLLAATGMNRTTDPVFDGENILPMLRGECATSHGPCFWSWNHRHQTCSANSAMREGPWKLYQPFQLEISGYSTAEPVPENLLPKPLAPMLFRLDADPAERRDLADLYPDRVRSMSESLESWFEQVMVDFAQANQW